MPYRDGFADERKELAQLEQKIHEYRERIAAFWEERRYWQEEHIRQGEPVLAEKAADPEKMSERYRRELRSYQRHIEQAKDRMAALEEYIEKEMDRAARAQAEQDRARVEAIPTEAQELFDEFKELGEAVELLLKLAPMEKRLRRVAEIPARYADLITEAKLLRERGFDIPDLPSQPVEPQGYRRAFEGTFKCTLGTVRRSRKLERLDRKAQKVERDKAAQKRIDARNEGHANEKAAVL